MKIITLTGPSGSGKTTIQEELLKYGYSKPTLWTTRKNVFDKELDECIFILDEQFLTKIGNNDFIEYSQDIRGDWSGTTGPLDQDKNYCFVVDPIGLAKCKKYFGQLGIELVSFYLDIDQKSQEERLGERGDSCNTICKASKDFDYMKSFDYDVILDGELTIEENILNIINHLG